MLTLDRTDEIKEFLYLMDIGDFVYFDVTD